MIVVQEEITWSQYLMWNYLSMHQNKSEWLIQHAFTSYIQLFCYMLLLNVIFMPTTLNTLISIAERWAGFGHQCL